MSILEKLKSIRAAVWNITFEHAFTFDPGKRKRQ
jgi:hypothetical protein